MAPHKTAHTTNVETVWKRHRILLFVDHGGMRVLEEIKDCVKTPRAIRRLAEIRGKVVDAWLFSDLPRLGDSDTEKERRIREWEDAGFTIVTCGRTGNASGETDRSKESIDFRLSESVHKELQKIDHAASWHFIFVVGDTDFRPVIQTLIRQGIRTSVFLTMECALLQSTLAQQLYELYALFNAKNDPRFRTIMGQVLHDDLHLGTLSDSFEPTPKQQDVFDRAMGTTMRCSRCRQTFPADEYVMHPCYPGRKYFYRCTDPGSGPGNAGLLTREYTEEIVGFLEGTGAKEFFRWYAARVKDGVCAHELTYLLERTSPLRRTVVETSLILGELINIAEGWDAGEARSFALGTVRMDACLNYGIVEEADGRMFVPDALKDGLLPLIEESRRRADTLVISRAVAGDDNILRPEDLRPIIFRSPEGRRDCVRGIAGALEETLERASDRVTALRAQISDTALYWIARDVCGRTQDELDAATTIAAKSGSCAVAAWIPIVRDLPNIAATGQDDLSLANTIAMTAGRHMTPQSMDILIETGVLVHDANMLVRGRLSHPAFTAFAPSNNGP